MTQEQPLAPWETRYRAPLPSGLVYPVRPAEVADALRAAGVEIGALGLGVASSPGRFGPRPPAGMLLIYASWQERLPWVRYETRGGDLRILAVPAAKRDEVHALMIGEALPAAASWLASASRQGQVWREMHHERWISLGERGLVVEDREGGTWSTSHRS